jgi:AcrR family transcriptional regulator
MGREQRPGDWAAWMGAPAPVSPRATRTGSAVRAPASTTEPEQEPEPEPEADGPPAHRSARREATRQRILDAARAVFAERGVIGGSVEDICERAGFTRGAFYSNFTDKDDVVQALVEREQALLMEHLDAALVEVTPEIAGADEQLPAVVASIVDRVLRTIPVDRTMILIQTELEIHAIRRPDMSRQLLEINQRFRERLGAFIVDAVGHAGLELTVSPADLVDAMTALAERSTRRALLEGGGADPDELARVVLPSALLSLTRPIGPRS